MFLPVSLCFQIKGSGPEYFLCAECDSRHYGSSCSSTCGNCYNGTRCSQYSGVCPEAYGNPRCRAGFSGRKCLDCKFIVTFNYFHLNLCTAKYTRYILHPRISDSWPHSSMRCLKSSLYSSSSSSFHSVYSWPVRTRLPKHLQHWL